MSGSSSYASTAECAPHEALTAAPTPRHPADHEAATPDAATGAEGGAVALPDYLRHTYSWAYLNPVSRALFDQSFVVSAILWGNANKLIDAALAAIEPGQRVLQTACVYGSFSARLATHVGPAGSLDVIDVAPIQVKHCQRKLDGFPNATVRLADAVAPGDGPYDAVCCFFLLHEVPDTYKRRIVNALLDRIEPGGKVVFVDYHRPRPGHPLRGLMRLVFACLEPFAPEIWEREIESYAVHPDQFTWTKDTYFGGLYQRVVAQRRAEPGAA